MKTLPTILLALVLAGAGLAFQEATALSANAGGDPQTIASQLPTYPLSTCPVSGEPLDAMGEPKDVLHEGRLVRFCCGSCVKAFKKDPAKTLEKIDAAVVEAQLASYPLKTCPVSGEPLGGEMGDPIDVVHGTRLVRLCCKGCKKGFAKDPAGTLAKVDAAYIAQQMPSYPLTTCLVSGEPLEGEGHDQLYGLRLTRFCCPKCAKAFEKEPAKYLAKLDSAKAPAAKPAK